MLGQILRRLRERAGLRLLDVADAVACQFSAIGKWERGATMPAADQLSRALARLGATPVEIADVVRAAAPEAWPTISPVDPDRLAQIRGRWLNTDTRRIFNGRTRVELSVDEARLLALASEDIAELMEMLMGPSPAPAAAEAA